MTGNVSKKSGSEIEAFSGKFRHFQGLRVKITDGAMSLRGAKEVSLRGESFSISRPVENCDNLSQAFTGKHIKIQA
ncbi:MAG: hypothetical protein QM760_17940 [Nibricoccus sp.]